MSRNLVGFGLRYPHYDEVIKKPPNVGWLEVHSENFFHESSVALSKLLEIRKFFPISLHGVGLSLGSRDGVSEDHLHRLKKLIEEVNPIMVSEHLSWGYVDSTYIPDLLPIPYNLESMDILYKNISQTQDYLQREILIENPSSYLEYASSTEEEANFLVTLAKRAGCKILLDINNIFVSCKNHNWNANNYLDVIPGELVKEIHIAGHMERELSNGQKILIDTHDNFVCDGVWQLYQKTIKKFGPKYTLIEWDNNIPEINTLILETEKALANMKEVEKAYG